MRLEKIKIAGFKSFVDPTTIPVPENLVAIVGPNGCGKSNIIDAVRWVMGESSAKHLRGGTMSDVIFNGSSSRKPVGMASVELIFDNSEGKAGGEYAKFNQISIKRQVSRDGQSVYLLNGSRCRRKDITDIFLGTGLGSRSYAIIEQGTISRLVEAKPDDLRVFIEEAAGVSRYKERRGETETRLRHTSENLERLVDIRDEVAKQMKVLAQQAKKAERYTELRNEARELEKNLWLYRWQQLDLSLSQVETKLEASAESLESWHRQQFALNQETEEKRQSYKQQQQAFNQQQAEFYQLGNEISALQNKIEHEAETRENYRVEQERLRQTLEQAELDIEENQLQHETMQLEVQQLEDALIDADATLETTSDNHHDHQQRLVDWQHQADDVKSRLSEQRQMMGVQQARLDQLSRQDEQHQQRLQRLTEEKNAIAANTNTDESDLLMAHVEQLEQQLESDELQSSELEQLLSDYQQQSKALQQSLHDDRSSLEKQKGQLGALELLQQHAMGKDKNDLSLYLKKFNLLENQRLAERINVEPGWEKAVEVVLGAMLEAICTSELQQDWLDVLQGNTKELIALIWPTASNVDTPPTRDLPRLSDKVQTTFAVSGFLHGIYCANDEPAAQQIAEGLKAGESVITPNGTWFGSGWIKATGQQSESSGVLLREKQINQLRTEVENLEAVIDEKSEELLAFEEKTEACRSERLQLQQALKQIQTELNQKQSTLSALIARQEQQTLRLKRVSEEIADLNQLLEQNDALRIESAQLSEEAGGETNELQQRAAEITSQIETLNAEIYESQHAVKAAEQQKQALSAKQHTLKANLEMSGNHRQQLQRQYESAKQRMRELEMLVDVDTVSPVEDQQQIESLENQKLLAERKIKSAQEALDELEKGVAECVKKLQTTEKEMAHAREKLDRFRIEREGLQVRLQNVDEQLDRIGLRERPQEIPAFDPAPDEAVWVQNLDGLNKSIERLGAINLTAIEEHKTQQERFEYLEQQCQDLAESVETLEKAIGKIDGECRVRFKETFDLVNAGLQRNFPKLFGGGQAYLELNENNLLEAGVSIIARPPGKRNSSIHLLSGGEKALTAVALVFSIFELNPAPFCLLDEVDAPLDDANVGRFSRLVAEMSAQVQFLFITHNKVTMEIARHLAGVTMKEPGVSRMVAVDIDEAVELAAS